MPKQKIRWWVLVLSIVIAELTGMLSSFLAGDMRAFYANLVLPPLSPPGWLFGVAWSILFLLMGLAAGLIFEIKIKKFQKTRQTALLFYAIQLIINFFWSIIYFKFQWQIGSIIVIVALDILVLLTMLKFSKLNKLAGYLLIPYLTWLLFATYLTIGTVILN